jgi:hypothetical protein
MTVIGLGVSLTHAHAAGASHHVHRQGWNLSNCPCVPCDGCEVPSETHRHLVLFGLEFPSESASESSACGISITELVVSQTCDTNSVDDSFGLFDVFPQTAIESLVAADTGSTLPRGFSSSAPLSAFALRAMSGVLRS